MWIPGANTSPWTSSPLPRIRTDPVLLERALANLIDNALIHAGRQ